MYTVHWSKTALDELTELWLAADSSQRERITSVIESTDRQLSIDPLAVGESREQGRRVFFEPPLGMALRIDEVDRIVQVLHVWRISIRPAA